MLEVVFVVATVVYRFEEGRVSCETYGRVEGTRLRVCFSEVALSLLIRYAVEKGIVEEDLHFADSSRWSLGVVVEINS